jgi:hypothetical protein
VARLTSKSDPVAAPVHTIGDMQLNQRQVATGTYCGGNHPQQIEYSYALVDGDEVPHSQSDARCFRTGCPDNAAAMAREQCAGRPKA